MGVECQKLVVAGFSSSRKACGSGHSCPRGRENRRSRVPIYPSMNLLSVFYLEIIGHQGNKQLVWLSCKTYIFVCKKIAKSDDEFATIRCYRTLAKYTAMCRKLGVTLRELRVLVFHFLNLYFSHESDEETCQCTCGSRANACLLSSDFVDYNNRAQSTSS